MTIETDKSVLNGDTNKLSLIITTNYFWYDYGMLRIQITGGSMNLLNLFIDGGLFMWPIFACLIVGVSYCIYKQIILIKSKKLLLIEDYFFNTSDNVYNAEIIQNEVQKIYSNESLELDKGMSFLATLISLAPMLGFTGTVYGMIMAFRNIKIEEEISAVVVADGIETALLTTLFGLVVAMILQLNYNYFNTMIQNSESIIINNLMDKSNELLMNKGDQYETFK